MKVKSLNAMKTSRKRVEYRAFYGYSKEKASGTLTAVESRNCDFRGGKLSTGVGVEKYVLDWNPEIKLAVLSEERYGKGEKIFAHTYFLNGEKRDTVAVNTSNGNFFVYDEAMNALRALESSAQVVKLLTVFDENGEGYLLVCGKKNTYLYSMEKGATILFQNTEFAGACVCKERVFLGSGFTVFYSAPLQPNLFTESIDDGGKVEIPSMLGPIVGLETLGNAVYIFRRFGITKLTGGGEGRNFLFEDLAYASSGIVGSSVLRCKDEILFLSAEGICLFNGSGVRSVGDGVLPPPTGSAHTCYGAFAFGRAYLSYLDRDGNRRNAFIDLADERNVGELFLPQGLTDSCGRALCLINGQISKLDMRADLPTGEEYLFDAGALDFGQTGEKVLRKISLIGRGKCVLSVSGRNGKRDLAFDMGENGERSLNVFLKGEQFPTVFRLEKGCEILAMKVTLDKVEGVGK